MEEPQVPAVEEQEGAQGADEQSLLPALLLGAGAGLVGATLGWSIMSAYNSFSASEVRPPAPVIQAQEAPKVAAQPAPVVEPQQQAAYYLQVGAYHSRDGADALAEQLQSEGFDVLVKETGAFHRLIVGPAPSSAGLEEVTRKLAQRVGEGSFDLPTAWMTLGPVRESEL